MKSPEEAIEWALKAPNPAFGDADREIELRRFFELEGFEPSAAIDKARTRLPRQAVSAFRD